MPTCDHRRSAPGIEPWAPRIELQAPDAPPEWYAVYTRARHEKVVARELERRGLPTLLPLCRAVHFWKDRRRELELPLFPSYVFVRTHSTGRARVLSAPGAVYLVSDSRGPLAVAASEIESVRILAAVGSAAPYPYLRAGMRVRVMRGPLAGVEGLLAGNRRPHLVVVSITALSSSIRAEVHIEDVEPL